MIGQAPGHAAGGGDDKDIAVAVVFAGESDHRAIGREIWKSLDPGARCQAVSVATIAADDPEIVPIIEDDLRFADRGKAQQEQGIRLGCDGL